MRLANGGGAWKLSGSRQTRGSKAIFSKPMQSGDAPVATRRHPRFNSACWNSFSMHQPASKWTQQRNEKKRTKRKFNKLPNLAQTARRAEMRFTPNCPRHSSMFPKKFIPYQETAREQNNATEWSRAPTDRRHVNCSSHLG